MEEYIQNKVKEFLKLKQTKESDSNDECVFLESSLREAWKGGRNEESEIRKEFYSSKGYDDLIEKIERCIPEEDTIEEESYKFSLAWSEEKRKSCKVCQKTNPGKMFCARHCPKMRITTRKIKTWNACRNQTLDNLQKEGLIK